LNYGIYIKKLGLNLRDVGAGDLTPNGGISADAPEIALPTMLSDDDV
jgi:hypothetical protein